MIESVLVTNANGDSLLLTLMRPEQSGLIVRKIEGLGPAKANVNLRENPGTSGSQFNSARTPSRNILITLEFLPMPTIEATRLRTYRYFPTETRIRLDITTDAGVFYIIGYVEDNDPDIFSSQQTSVVSIICPDPAFRRDNGVIVGELQEWANLFSFPFENPVGETDLEFGEMFFQSIDFIIPLDGTMVVEPTITLMAEGGAVNNPRIFFYSEDNPDDVDSMAFSFTESLPALADGDRLIIVCERGNKSVTRYVAATDEYVNYLGALDFDSTWPVLRPGNNRFAYEADSGGAYIRFGYEYELKYAGV